MNQTKTLGLVLSGGGVKGIAHIGLLRALEEHQIQADIISGASAGALVGALYADGYSIDEMLQFFKQTPLFSFSMFSPIKPGLLDSEKYRKFLEQYFPGDRFEALAKPLYITTTNLEKGEWVVHEKGPLIQPLLASASMPPLFSPVEINGFQHADGGVMNNFPIDPLLDQGLFILGCNVSPLEVVPPDQLTTSLALLNRSQLLTWQSGIQPRLPLCDFLIEPEGINKVNFLNTDQIDQAYEIGYKAAQDCISRLKVQLTSLEST